MPRRRVHVLIWRATNWAERAFIFPLIAEKGLLRDAGLDVRVMQDEGPALADCDVLLVGSRFLQHVKEPELGRRGAIDWLRQRRGELGALVYADTSASTGTIATDVFDAVDLYLKKQLLRDRRRYLEPTYGSRVYAHYYREHFGIEDSIEEVQPALRESDLDKLALAWNSALANYDPLTTRLKKTFVDLRLERMFLQPLFYRYPRDFTAPSSDRPLAVACRINTTYELASVAFQRRRTAEILKDHVRTDLVDRRRYMDELRTARLAPSPFGWGEICFRDFEILLAGALLVKPDMSHLETWPALYDDGRTMLAHRWDMSDLAERVGDALAHYERWIEVARQGQERLRHALSKDGRESFVERFSALAQTAMARRSRPD